MSLYVGFAILWGLVALVIYGFVSELRGAFRAFASIRWPAVTGTVVESGWKEADRGGFEPVVRYRYTVEGREFRGHRIAFWGFLRRGGFTENSAQDWSNRWIAEHPATVHHHPKDPEIAVLVPGSNWRLVVSLLVSVLGGGSFLMFALILTFG
jgi:Protein of unknown function (DUF3592)